MSNPNDPQEGNAPDPAAHVQYLTTEQALHAWVDAESWDASRLWLTQHAFLLEDALAEPLLAAWIIEAESSSSPLAADIGAYLRIHLRLLHCARQLGIDVAWAQEPKYQWPLTPGSDVEAK